MLVRARSSRRRWIFPKGKVEDGEEDWQAARREAREEAGVTGEIGHRPVAVFRHRKSGREITIPAFLLKVKREGRRRQKRRRPRWFSAKEAREKLALNRDEECGAELGSVILRARSLIRQRLREERGLE